MELVCPVLAEETTEFQIPKQGLSTYLPNPPNKVINFVEREDLRVWTFIKYQ